ncbi:MULTISPECIES: phage portal protein [Brevibacillus]|uniref:phage portal protein n=1 Tax=Brevibacillus TaxID=55080 RepID=UPI000EE4F5A7|nr:phage portal protein [Brevibacillus sp.]HBZ79032.1 phage portal protein [Brevibacillus sp.]
MSIDQYIREQHDANPEWFVEECNSVANMQRINNIIDIKEYLSGNHAILQTPSYMYNGREFTPRKIVLQYAKNVLNFSTSYLLSHPITLTGQDSVVKEYKKVYKKGKYDRIDFDVLDKITKYGFVAEYVFVDFDGTIKSKLIDPADSYPVYDDENNYIAFIEHYTTADNVSYYTVYYPDKVQKYSNKDGRLKLVGEYSNLSGLPIVYKNQNELDSTIGRSDLEDIVTIIDSMEDLLSKFADSFHKHHNPIPVVIGQQLKGGGLPSNVVGAGIALDDGSDFKMVSNQLDYKSFETIYKTLMTTLLDISNTPGVAMGKVDISNLSEVSIRLLYSLSDLKASMNEKYMREGMEQRFDKIRKLLELKGKRISDDAFDSLGIVFQYARPQSAKEVIDNLKVLSDMGAISIESILERSPYTNDVVQELERLKEYQMGNKTGNNDDQESMDSESLRKNVGK